MALNTKYNTRPVIAAIQPSHACLTGVLTVGACQDEGKRAIGAGEGMGLAGSRRLMGGAGMGGAGLGGPGSGEPEGSTVEDGADGQVVPGEKLLGFEWANSEFMGEAT